MGDRIAAEVFPPGEYLKEELEARGWTQVEFAEIIDRDTRLISEVSSGKRAITPETAIAFGEAFGTSPEFWMNLESQYQLSKVRSNKDSISRKAQLHSAFPVREMVKRGWIESTKNLDLLESQLLQFFGISSVGEKPNCAFAAKKTTYQDIPIQQVAWFCRAKALAKAAPAEKFSEVKLLEAIGSLKEHLEFVEGTRNVAMILARAGVRFVVVEMFPGSKIDGACFWLDKSSPVIALSLRFDRVDNFWHGLFHELDHIQHKEGMTDPILDVDLISNEEKPEIEVRANEAAAESLISKAELEGFVARVNPMFTDEKIVGFAKRLGVHPGIVVGQLQNRGLVPWQFHRKHLEKCREFVVASALTDGFGQVLNNVR